MNPLSRKSFLTQFAATAVGLGGMWFRGSAAHAQSGDELGDAPERVVRDYLHNISTNNYSANRGLFIGSNAPVVGVPAGEGIGKIWVRDSESVIKEGEDTGQSCHVIDGIETHALGYSLAAVTVEYHTAPYRVNCRASFTLTSEGGDWKIASLVFETRSP